MSQTELQTACRKCERMEVSDTKTLAQVLDTMKVEYKILSKIKADVFAKLNISKLCKALEQVHCELLRIQELMEAMKHGMNNDS